MSIVEPFVVDRSPRGVVAVSGPDTTSFLQSIVSQDLDPVAVGQSVPSLLLVPQGKLDVAFRARRTDDGWFLDTDADYGPRLAASLTRFRIRVKVEIDDVTSSTGMVSVVGTGADASDPLVAIPTRWGATTGVDVLGPIDAVHAWLLTVDGSIRRATAEEFEAFRIEAGVPRLGVDMDETTIPQEAFLDDAVSFTKGCFLGQELVQRIDTRGHVNRHLRRLRVAGAAVPPSGATVVAGDKEVGTVTSAAAVPGDGRVVALGMIRREIEPPAAVTLTWDSGATTTLATVLASESAE